MASSAQKEAANMMQGLSTLGDAVIENELATITDFCRGERQTTFTMACFIRTGKLKAIIDAASLGTTQAPPAKKDKTQPAKFNKTQTKFQVIVFFIYTYTNTPIVCT